MPTFTRKIHSLLPYIKITGLYFVLLAWLLNILGKIELQLWLNKIHTPYLDLFFSNITHLGDGLFIVFLLPVLLLCFSVRSSVFIVISTLISGISAQILKRLFFTGASRPMSILTESQVHLIQGVHQLKTLSFPSGHNATAFALFTALAYTCRKHNPSWQIIFAITAVLVGYSRIYLEQHWVIDALAGQIIGILGVFVSGYILTYHTNKNWGSQRLIDRFRKSKSIV